ncbi:hypothetical protein D1007_20363 [Hordeum vulgare]|nr:hypothetical protein D1007_20363 [Hordeum vulgare]
MFHGLERRASRALDSICGSSVYSPLVPDDAGYLDFFTKIMERLEAGTKQVGALIEEESHDILFESLMRVVVGDQVDALSVHFSPDNREGQGGAKENAADEDDNGVEAQGDDAGDKSDASL